MEQPLVWGVAPDEDEVLLLARPLVEGLRHAAERDRVRLLLPASGHVDLGIRKQEGFPAMPERRGCTDHLPCQHSVAEIQMVGSRDGKRDEVIEGSGLD